METAGQLARRRLRWSRRACISSMIGMALAFATTFPLMHVVSVASLFLAVAAAGLAFNAGRIRPWYQDSGSGGHSLHPWRWVVLGLLVLAGSMFVNLLVCATTRDVSKSVIALANLHSLDCVSRVYTEEHGIYPTALSFLVQEGHMTWKTLWTYGDTQAHLIEQDPDAYSSYVFRPLQTTNPEFEDADLVVAYEREPFQKVGPRIFSNRKHAVLFADRRTTFLDEQELREALARDRERRRELGWPEQPATTSPRD